MAEYSFRAAFRNSDGLTFDTFDEDNNHMDIIFIIFLLEWPTFMLLAWYLEQVITFSGVMLAVGRNFTFPIAMCNQSALCNSAHKVEYSHHLGFSISNV